MYFLQSHHRGRYVYNFIGVCFILENLSTEGLSLACKTYVQGMKLYRRQAEKDYPNIIHRKGFLSIQVLFSLIDDTSMKI